MISDFTMFFVCKCRIGFLETTDQKGVVHDGQRLCGVSTRQAEKTQVGPLFKCIYPGNEYADILCLTNLQCLNEARDSLCKKYFQKLNYLLPRQRYNT